MNEKTLYMKDEIMKEKKEMIIISLYVDDLLITGSSCTLIEQAKDELKKEFVMTDLGKMQYFLGMEIH